MHGVALHNRTTNVFLIFKRSEDLLARHALALLIAHVTVVEVSTLQM